MALSTSCPSHTVSGMYNIILTPETKCRSTFLSNAVRDLKEHCLVWRFPAFTRLSLWQEMWYATDGCRIAFFWDVILLRWVGPSRRFESLKSVTSSQLSNVDTCKIIERWWSDTHRGDQGTTKNYSQCLLFHHMEYPGIRPVPRPWTQWMQRLTCRCLYVHKYIYLFNAVLYV